MILCVCPNPSIDSFVWLEDFVQGGVNRILRDQRFPGGKGVHVALAAAELGEPVNLLGFWGGPTGQWIREICESKGVACYGPEIEDWSRTCLTFKTEGPYEHTEILGAGPNVSKKDFEDFLHLYKQLLDNASCVTMSGSWPKGVEKNAYAQLVQAGKQAGKKTFLDCTGEQLEQAFAKRPHAVHLNRSEGKAHFGVDAPELIAQKLAEHCDWAVVTAGAKGLYLMQDSQLIHAECKVEHVLSPVGSGDCLLAGIAVAHVRGLGMDDTARLGVACGAANCVREDLGMLYKSDVEMFMERVALKVIQVGPGLN